MVDRQYPARNDASRERLVAAVARLTPEDLDRPLGDGWTVRAALAHLAYWDRYAIALIDEWQRDGFRRDPGFFSDLPNDASLPDWLALPPAYVRAQVVEAARLADRRAAAVPTELADAVASGGMPEALARNMHRGEHLDQIEAALRL